MLRFYVFDFFLRKQLNYPEFTRRNEHILTCYFPSFSATASSQVAFHDVLCSRISELNNFSRIIPIPFGANSYCYPAGFWSKLMVFRFAFVEDLCLIFFRKASSSIDFKSESSFCTAIS